MRPEDKSIGELAYGLWQARGCPAGTAEQDWLDAERQLRAMQSPKAESVDDSLRDSFAASDPSATPRPDAPPANADAKWKAAEVARKSSPRRSSRGNPSDAAH